MPQSQSLNIRLDIRLSSRSHPDLSEKYLLSAVDHYDTAFQVQLCWKVLGLTAALTGHTAALVALLLWTYVTLLALPALIAWYHGEYWLTGSLRSEARTTA